MGDSKLPHDAGREQARIQLDTVTGADGALHVGLGATNVTPWSQKCADSFKFAMSVVDVVAVSEHKADTAAKIKKLRKDLHFAGFRAFVQPAVRTEQGGVSAGVFLACRHHLEMRRLADRKEKHLVEECIEDERMCFAVGTYRDFEVYVHRSLLARWGGFLPPQHRLAGEGPASKEGLG